MIAHMIHLRCGEMDVEAVAARLRGSLWRIRGWREARLDEAAACTLALVPGAGGAWISVCFSPDDHGHEVLSELAADLAAELPAIATLSLEDAPLSLRLFHRDNAHLAIVPQGPAAEGPPFEPGPWVAAAPAGVTAEDLRAAWQRPGGHESPVSALANRLGLPEIAWSDGTEPFLADEEGSSEAPQLLRFTGAPAAAEQPVSGAAGPVRFRIPALFLGTLPEVRRRWRTVARRAMREKSLKAALAEVEFLDLETTAAKISLGATKWSFREGEPVFWLNPMIEELHKAADTELGEQRSAQRRYELIMPRLWEGLEEFWFCLGILAHRKTSFLPSVPSGIDIDAEFQTRGLRFLKGFMVQWPALLKFQPRYVFEAPIRGGWRNWNSRIAGFAHKAGISPADHRRLVDTADPEEAGRIIHAFLRERPER